MPDSGNEKTLLTIKEVCREFNVHPNTLRNWDRSGKLKAMRVGPRKDRRYKRDEVFSFFYGEDPTKKDSTKEEPVGEELNANIDNARPLGSSLASAKED